MYGIWIHPTVLFANIDDGTADRLHAMRTLLLKAGLPGDDDAVREAHGMLFSNLLVDTPRAAYFEACVAPGVNGESPILLTCGSLVCVGKNETTRVVLAVADADAPRHQKGAKVRRPSSSTSRPPAPFPKPHSD